MLERDHGFTFVSDDKLMAAVNVSRDDEDNFLVPVDAAPDEDDNDADDDLDADFVTIRATLDPSSIPTRAGSPTDDLRRRAPACGAGRSAAEEDLDHVPVANPVGLALRAELAGLARLGHRAQGEQVLVRRPSRPG